MTTPTRGKDHWEQSVQMLRLALDGMPYVEVAATYGISRTNVEQRVKTVARRLLAREVVAGLEPHAVLHLSRLRQHRDAVVAALDQAASKAQTLTAPMTVELIDAQRIDRAIQLVRRRSLQPERDVALFTLMLTTGALPLEIARMRVSDYLESTGQVRLVSCLRADRPTGPLERPAYFTSPVLQAAMSAYLATRLRRRWGLGTGPAYRGLDPASALFLDAKAEAFKVSLRTKGKAKHWRCPGIHQVLQMIFFYADWKGVSATSLRRWLVNRLLNLGASAEEVCLMLGVSNIRSWKRFGQPVHTLEAIAGSVL